MKALTFLLIIIISIFLFLNYWGRAQPRVNEHKLAASENKALSKAVDVRTIDIEEVNRKYERFSERRRVKMRHGVDNYRPSGKSKSNKAQ